MSFTLSSGRQAVWSFGPVSKPAAAAIQRCGLVAIHTLHSLTPTENDLIWKTALHNGNNRGRNCHLRVTGDPATLLPMMSETEKQFPLIRAASMNRQGAKSKYLTVSQ